MTTSRVRKLKHGRDLARRSRLPYTSRVVLLSRGELAFYYALKRAVSGKFLLTFKVRAADLLTCSSDAWDEGFGHMVAKHHLDFVLCNPITTAIIAAIELDDKSHSLAHRKRRDTFLNQAFSAANIPLIRIRAQSKYNPQQISELIERQLELLGTHGKVPEHGRGDAL